jgi:hypothetical protein
MKTAMSYRYQFRHGKQKTVAEACGSGYTTTDVTTMACGIQTFEP